jgi:tetratricopeptide (TPR) repeat protein
MIGSNSVGGTDSGTRNSAAKTFRMEPSITKNEGPSSSSANSLEEWARTYNIEPLVRRRERIHKEKREGKAVTKQPSGSETSKEMANAKPTKAYLSKLFDAPASQYSNWEVKQMYAAAKTADKNGDRAVTKQILQKLKEATPRDARIYRRLARIENEEGNVEGARKVLKDGLKLHPNNSYLWHGMGQLEMKVGNDDAARRHYMKAIQLDPAFPNPYHALATKEHSKGHIAKAMKLLKAGLQYCPTNHRLHHALGDLYREAKMLDMAEKSFLRALEHGPEVSRGFAYTSLSHVAYELGDIAKCRSWLRKAVAINNGRHAKGWISLSRLEESEGDSDAARAICIAGLNNYEKVLLNRANPQLSSSVSLTASLLQDPVQMKNEMFEKLPKYRSGDQFLVVYRNWARLEERYGTPETVEEVYSRASTAFPLDWKLPLEWALYNAKQGYFERAGLLFREACHTVTSK